MNVDIPERNLNPPEPEVYYCQLCGIEIEAKGYIEDRICDVCKHNLNTEEQCN